MIAASLTFPSRWSVRVSLTAIILKEELAPTATAVAVYPRSTVCVVGAMMLVGSTCPPGRSCAVVVAEELLMPLASRVQVPRLLPSALREHRVDL